MGQTRWNSQVCMQTGSCWNWASPRCEVENESKIGVHWIVATKQRNGNVTRQETDHKYCHAGQLSYAKIQGWKFPLLENLETTLKFSASTSCLLTIYSCTLENCNTPYRNNNIDTDDYWLAYIYIYIYIYQSHCLAGRVLFLQYPLCVSEWLTLAPERTSWKVRSTSLCWTDSHNAYKTPSQHISYKKS